ncbi:hypothetical protein WJX72_003706 [[Myrmecia] bisecta]|uniref:Uncharacterized protein n=1 Tax=[Myrmecia] bisecta TaxID=41462 RepID=A0AAW1Q739_9CHLO
MYCSHSSNTFTAWEGTEGSYQKQRALLRGDGPLGPQCEDRCSPQRQTPSGSVAAFCDQLAAPDLARVRVRWVEAKGGMHVWASPRQQRRNSKTDRC